MVQELKEIVEDCWRGGRVKRVEMTFFLAVAQCTNAPNSV
jgi:hypothetical protein